MPVLRTILLPTDFSPAAAHTARCAAAMAGRFESNLLLLHVLPPMDRSVAALEGGGVLLDEVIEYQKIRAEQNLADFAARELAGRQAETVLLEGDPAVSIVDYARTRHADLIMMPTRGCGPFRRFILGSVTAKVLHDVHCPVWTGVHVENMPVPNESPIGTVLCALDLLNGSERILAWASEFASRTDAELVVVHAIPSLAYNPEIYYLEADLRRFLIGQAREKITRMLASTSTPDAKIVIRGGAAPVVVRSAAEDHQAAMVVVGRGGAVGLLGRLRTNCYAIIRESPCPVVSV